MRYRVADQLGLVACDCFPGRSGVQDGFLATSTGGVFAGAGSIGFGRSARNAAGGFVLSATAGNGPLAAFHPPVASSEDDGKIAGLPGLAVDHSLSLIDAVVSNGCVEVST